MSFSIKVGTIAVTAIVTLAPIVVTAQTSTATNTDVESRVRSYFADIPIMIRIAECESKFRQFDTDGSALHGGAGGAMVGIFQIHGTIHADTASSSGVNIDTVDGNLAYARHLYEAEGTAPWISSFPCWHSETSVNKSVSIDSSSNTFSMDLSMGMENDQIVTLQKLLNAIGFTVARDGPGSVGNETSKFGALTRAAVKKFQCSQGLVCAGDEYSTGYGFVDARTRALLSSASTTPMQSQSLAVTMYTPEQLTIISQLQAQIAMLQKVLADLLKSRQSS